MLSLSLGGTAQVLSPRRKVVESVVPVADKSKLPILTAPVALLFTVPVTKVPKALVKLVTAPNNTLFFKSVPDILTFVFGVPDLNPAKPQMSVTSVSGAKAASLIGLFPAILL